MSDRDDIRLPVDELYGLALDEFVPRRDALAKRLRADGRREEAAEVAALRKPSVAAWAANQAIRSQPRAARGRAGRGGGGRGPPPPPPPASRPARKGRGAPRGPRRRPATVRPSES